MSPQSWQLTPSWNVPISRQVAWGTPTPCRLAGVVALARAENVTTFVHGPHSSTGPSATWRLQPQLGIVERRHDRTREAVRLGTTRRAEGPHDQCERKTEKKQLHGLLRVLPRICVELNFATTRAEVVRLAVVLAPRGSFGRIHLHAADDVSFHKGPPVVSCSGYR